MKKLLVVLLLMALNLIQAQSYKRFAGKITVVTEEAIAYDNELLLLYGIEPKLRPVFESGILYPALFRPQAGLDAKATEIAHRITVSEFKIVPNASPKVKAFRFVVLQNNNSAPRSYYAELLNPSGNWKMDILTFLRGSRLLTLKAQ